MKDKLVKILEEIVSFLYSYATLDGYVWVNVIVHNRAPPRVRRNVSSDE